LIAWFSGRTVLLDAWFNRQKRADAIGRQVSFHCKWDDLSNSGYSLSGPIFRNCGVLTIPRVIIDSTSGSTDNPHATCTTVLWGSSSGKPIRGVRRRVSVLSPAVFHKHHMVSHLHRRGT
jgi:hypothetical protein